MSAAVAARIEEVLDRLEGDDLAPFENDWRGLDLLDGRVRLAMDDVDTNLFVFGPRPARLHRYTVRFDSAAPIEMMVAAVQVAIMDVSLPEV